MEKCDQGRREEIREIVRRDVFLAATDWEKALIGYGCADERSKAVDAIVMIAGYFQVLLSQWNLVVAGDALWAGKKKKTVIECASRARFVFELTA